MEGKQTNAFVERGDKALGAAALTEYSSPTEGQSVASLEGQAEWKTGESKWIGESDTGNIVTFPVKIRF